MAWYVIDVNPEPWRVPPMTVGRSHQGKAIVKAGRDQQLHSFQQAIRDALPDDVLKIEGKVKLTLYFWRVRAEYETYQSRTVRKHEVDATNMQKATEDALQGVFFDNDKDVSEIRSVIVEQGPDVRPRIVICVESFDLKSAMNEMPIDVYAKAYDEAPLAVSQNVWPPVN